MTWQEASCLPESSMTPDGCWVDQTRVSFTPSSNSGLTTMRGKDLVTITTATLDFVRKEIWLPRCKQVKSLLGSWRTRLRRLQDEPPPPPPAEVDPFSVSGPEQRMQDDRPHVGFAGVADSNESAIYWNNLNKQVFDVEHYLRIVAPSWAY